MTTANLLSLGDPIRAAAHRPLHHPPCVRLLFRWSVHPTFDTVSDKYRSYAHQQAWYQQDGQTTIFNPWGKRRIPSSNLTDNDEENAHRTRTNQSDSQILSSAEYDRVSNNRDGFPVPPHSSSMPVQSRMGSFPSQESGTPISNTSIPEDEPINMPTRSEEEGPRKRKSRGILGKFHRTGRHDDETESSKPPKQKYTFVGQLKATLFCSPINVLLVMVPVGIGVHFSNVSSIGVFVINFIAIIPLAALLSYATEELALRTGETFGGLLNATFGLV